MFEITMCAVISVNMFIRMIHRFFYCARIVVVIEILSLGYCATYYSLQVF